MKLDFGRAGRDTVGTSYQADTHLQQQSEMVVNKSFFRPAIYRIFQYFTRNINYV